jgi:Domain of unknown function (DUF6468)
MIFSVLMDLVVAGLLVAAIVYCALLNRRLGALRADKGKLEEAIHGLHQVSLRAESGVAALRGAAEDVGRQLQEKIELAQSLREDLAYMIDRSGGVADRLEGAIRANRQATPAPQAAPEASDPRLPEKKRREPVPPAATARPAAPEPAPAADKTVAARVAGFPSRAERELRRALDGRR